MSQTQNIPWKRISVEATAIVASILLAFAIDAWWQNRQVRVDEQEVLVGLKAEFAANRETLARHLAGYSRSIQSLEDFVALVEGGQSTNAKPTVLAVLAVMHRPGTTDLGNGTLNALISSGRVEILASRKLRTLLTAWSGVIDEVWDDQANNAKMVLQVYIPYFVQENYSRYSIERSSGEASTIDRILTDSTFLFLVELSLSHNDHAKGELERAITAVDEIIAEIDNSMT
jgi:hypothetical protein